MFTTYDLLWDGENCGPYSKCCSFNTPPWFYKSLPQPTNDDLEVRLCGSAALSVEDMLILLNAYFLSILQSAKVSEQVHKTAKLL